MTDTAITAPCSKCKRHFFLTAFEGSDDQVCRLCRGHKPKPRFDQVFGDEGL